MNGDMFDVIRDIYRHIDTFSFESKSLNKLSGILYNNKEELIDVSIRLRHAIIDNIYFVPTTNLIDISEKLNKIGKINYISKNIPHVYATVPLSEIRSLAKDPSVEEISVEPIYHTQNISFDRLLSLGITGPDIKIPLGTAVDSTNVKALWNKGLTGQGIRIANIDTGIDTDPTKPYSSLFLMPDSTSKVIHSKAFGIDVDENGNETPAPNIDRVGHGTATAACAAGRVWKSSVGDIYGSAPDALLIDANVVSKVYSKYYKKYYYTMKQRDVTKAADWILSSDVGNVDIVYMSIGTFIESKDMETIIENFSKNNIVVIVAAGNEGPGYGSISSPASYYNSVAVGSVALQTDNYNGSATFSSRGPVKGGYIKPDVLAPGGNVEMEFEVDGTIGGNELFYVPDVFLKDSSNVAVHAGTSFSTPITAGIFACMMQDTEININRKLKNIPFSGTKNNDSGYGAINSVEVYNLLKSVKGFSSIKTIKVNNYDPFVLGPIEGTFISDGVCFPTPYNINSKELVYYVDVIDLYAGIGVLVYDVTEKKYVNKGKVLDGGCGPGIVYYNNKYYAFYRKRKVVNGKHVITLNVSESDDGINWTNEREIDTSIIDKNKHQYDYYFGLRYGASVINNKIYLYIAAEKFLYKDVNGYNVFGYYITVQEVDLNSSKLVSNNIAFSFGTSKRPGSVNTPMGIYAPYVTYNSNDNMYYMYITSPTSFRYFLLIEAVSRDGLNFTFNRYIELPYIRDYNSYNGLCYGVMFNNKLYYSDGWFLDALFGKKTKIYIDNLSCGIVMCSFNIE